MKVGQAAHGFMRYLRAVCWDVGGVGAAPPSYSRQDQCPPLALGCPPAVATASLGKSLVSQPIDAANLPLR